METIDLFLRKNIERQNQRRSKYCKEYFVYEIALKLWLNAIDACYLDNSYAIFVLFQSVVKEYT